MKQLKIVFDSNESIPWSSSEENYLEQIFSKELRNLNSFIQKNDLKDRVKICLTDMVARECLIELQNRTIEKCASTHQNYKLLADLVGNKIEEIDKNTLRSKFVERYEKKIAENNIEILPAPVKTDMSSLSDRAINYRPPFEAKGKGFKDTMLWLSILESVGRNKEDRYVLVTEDKVFYKPEIQTEFIEHAGHEILITSPASLEEVIDDDLKLGIGLGKIKDEILSKLENDKSSQSNLTEKGLDKLVEDSSGFRVHYFEWKSEVVNLLFKSAEVNVKDKIGTNSYKAEVVGMFRPLYRGSETNKGTDGLLINPMGQTSSDYVRHLHDILSTTSSVVSAGYGTSHRPESIQISFEISYDKSKKVFSVLNVGQATESFNFYKF